MQQLSPEKIEETRQNFSFFDRDGNGFIDVKEFIELIKTISPETTEAQAINGFELVDENTDGLIEFDEFLEWWQTVWYEF
ncbi:MAG: EF-hand domain-containing protein [Gammaproteobacteria bacterium]